MEIRIGSSGWSYEAWEGIFYSIGEKNKLQFYSKFFNTVEVDSTFYSFPTKQLIETWYKNTPEEFKFSLKIPKVITHEEKLSAHSLIELNRFLELIEPLKNKLGVLLIQLPPSFNKDKYLDRFLTFLSNLDNSYNWAIEFRNVRWLEDSTFKILEKHNVAYTIVDEPILPKVIQITSQISVFRFHGRGKSIWYNYLYSDEEIDEWSSKIFEVSKKSKETYVYFNNHYRAFAVTNAIQLLKKLGMSKKEHEEMLTKLKASLKMEYHGLLSFVEKKDNSIEELKSLTTESRYERAMAIDEKEISIAGISDEELRGWVSGYFIEINFKNKIIKHECQDWINNISKSDFILCKHILAFMRKIPDPLITKFLEKMKNKDEWKFEARISF